MKDIGPIALSIVLIAIGVVSLIWAGAHPFMLSHNS
jgi:hypothetical protein